MKKWILIGILGFALSVQADFRERVRLYVTRLGVPAAEETDWSVIDLRDGNGFVIDRWNEAKLGVKPKLANLPTQQEVDDEARKKQADFEKWDTREQVQTLVFQKEINALRKAAGLPEYTKEEWKAKLEEADKDTVPTNLEVTP